MHDVIVVGIPILAGILFNRNDIRELRGEINSLRSEMYSRFDKVDMQLSGINADLRQFYHLSGKLEADVYP
jgi:hypothetical protein